MKRPKPWAEGLVPVVAPNWRLATGAHTKCRRSTHHPCPRTPVAELNRRRYNWRGTGKTQDSWWAYCDQHMYDHYWVQDGQVWCWAQPTAPDAWDDRK